LFWASFHRGDGLMLNGRMPRGLGVDGHAGTDDFRLGFDTQGQTTKRGFAYYSATHPHIRPIATSFLG
jgi:hypothetical protein